MEIFEPVGDRLLVGLLGRALTRTKNEYFARALGALSLSVFLFHDIWEIISFFMVSIIAD